MDVIGSDDCPPKGTTQLTNGNGTSAEEFTVAAVAGSSAGKRKKAKRKNKAKNSQPEPEMAGETNMTRSATLDTTTMEMKLSPKAVLAKEVEWNGAVTVNSNCNKNSSKHSSTHSNGLPEEPSAAAAESSVDAISKKLEQCVQLGRNGITRNGLANHGSNDSAELPGEEIASTVAQSGKKKHRSRQTKKGPSPAAHLTTCIEEKNGEKGGKSHPTTTALIEAEDTSEKSEPTDGRNVPEPTGPDSVSTAVESKPTLTPMEITYQVYESERQMPAIMALIQKDLSEPYSIYTYRYFIHNWPKLCFLALHKDTCVGAIVCKLDIHRQETRRGYIAMLAVDKDYRKLKIGTTLVQKAIQAMLEDNADEVVLETEITNQPALRLYENLGFVRDKRLFHYYLNGVDALRLKLWFR
ncbi:N-alpha-acetyltransferase 30A [Anopheles maculipalpis]|uniref:N-alpha-acetyltransferase 30A n=1 Tax=Anopheles maculipalpis TaxID=1496333 RepID=UPI002159ABE9|nr:N-alpha-acetyltransferase 30A [Anopheles maculipalpis]